MKVLDTRWYLTGNEGQEFVVVTVQEGHKCKIVEHKRFRTEADAAAYAKQCGCKKPVFKQAAYSYR